MSNPEAWYIVKQPAGNCQIVAVQPDESLQRTETDTWGPFSSESEAIARRVGLIRSGKCQPV